MTYIVTIQSNLVKLKISYKEGIFSKVEVLQGRFEGEYFWQLGKIFPPLESLIEEWQGVWGNVIIYKKLIE